MIDIYGESSQDEDVSMNAWTMAAQAVCVLLRFIEREFGMVPVESGIRFECLDEKDTMMVLQSHVVEALNVFQGMWECPGTGGGVHKHSLYRCVTKARDGFHSCMDYGCDAIADGDVHDGVLDFVADF